MAAGAWAYMPMPPTKLPSPWRGAAVMTKKELLDAGGSCFFSGGFCRDRGGNMWDCSDQNNCVAVTGGTRT
jgi:hypothetical protein